VADERRPEVPRRLIAGTIALMVFGNLRWRMPFSRIMQQLGHRRWFAKLGKVLVPLDRGVASLTRGRVVALGLVPSLILTTTGRKTGKERVQPLIYVPDGDGIILIGSNWGQPHHPSWSANLLANPVVRVRIKGVERSVTARLATGEERDRLWRKALQTWPAYSTYARRAGDRQIRVFRLTPN
jgi:deazaflavin-dependent oxidoreductase (nitroreductase family)